MKFKYNPYIFLLLALMTASGTAFAGQAFLKGRITMQDGSLPATVVLHSYADESFSAASNIAKDGTFSFSVDVPRATLYNIRFLRSTYDVMLSPAEKETRVNITLNKEMLVDINTENSPENDAYKAFHVSVNRYDGKLRDHFVYCENEDSCEKNCIRRS